MVDDVATEVSLKEAKSVVLDVDGMRALDTAVNSGAVDKGAVETVAVETRDEPCVGGFLVFSCL